MSGGALEIEGEWTATTAGGCPKHASWVRNPQYSLLPTVPNATYTLELKQHQPERDRHPIGLWIMTGSSRTQRIVKLTKSQTVRRHRSATPLAPPHKMGAHPFFGGRWPRPSSRTTATSV